MTKRESLMRARGMYPFMTTQPPEIVFNHIVRETGRQFLVTEYELLGRARTERIIDARQSAMLLLRRYTGTSSVNVGVAFGRDHATILHAWKAAESKRDVDAKFKARLEAVERELDRVLNGQEAK